MWHRLLQAVARWFSKGEGAPALRVERADPEEVRVTVRVRFGGNAHTSAREQAARGGIEELWNRSEGGVTLRTRLAAGEGGVRFWLHDGRDAALPGWMRGQARSYTPYWFLTTAPPVYAYVEGRSSEEIAYDAAHEFGHVLGLPDRYREYAPGQPARSGYERHLMAYKGRELTGADLRAITVSIARRLGRIAWWALLNYGEWLWRRLTAGKAR